MTAWCAAALTRYRIQEPQLVELADRCNDSFLRSRRTDVEGPGQIVGDVANRILTIAPMPNEACRRVEPVNLLSPAVEHDRVPVNFADAHVRSAFWATIIHSYRIV